MILTGQALSDLFMTASIRKGIKSANMKPTGPHEDADMPVMEEPLNPSGVEPEQAWPELVGMSVSVRDLILPAGNLSIVNRAHSVIISSNTQTGDDLNG